MGLFSKWFGLNNGGDSEQKEEMQPSLNMDQIQQPHDLPEALRYIVKKWGVDYLQSRSMLNVLNDFRVFKDIPAAKHIIQNMQANGYIEKISQSNNWTLDSKSIAAKYSTEFGAKKDIVIYLVQCVGYGLGKNTETPQYSEEKEVSQPQYIDPADQNINFHPQQVNQSPINNTPIQPVPQQVPIVPYDPKCDLPNYRYPCLDLLKQNYELKSFIDSEDLNAMANNVVRIFVNLGLEVNSIKLADGPMIMFYEVELTVLP